MSWNYNTTSYINQTQTQKRTLWKNLTPNIEHALKKTDLIFCEKLV